MSWLEYYDILEEFGSFRKAPKNIMQAAARGNPNTPHDAMLLAQQKYNFKKYGQEVLTHVHDADCPKCGFPETVMVRSAKNGELLDEYCSKECGWRRKK